MIPVCVPWMPGNEIKYANDAVSSGWISGLGGKYIDKFEKGFADFIGVKHGVSCTNGYAALHLACDAIGLKKGDEVIVPTFTNISPLNAIIQTGAKPVLVDIESDTWNINPNLIMEKITPKTSAILLVHIYGHPCNMDYIMDIANDQNLSVIEDCAEAHGAEYMGNKVGSFGDIGCFSFLANKILTSGEGGMCTTNNVKLSDRMKLMRSLAFKVPRFEHDEIGFNYRLSNVNAAIGTAQVENVDNLIEARRNVGLKYNNLLRDVKGLQLPVEKDYAKNVYWMYGVVLDNTVTKSKDEVRVELKERGVDTRSFFIPMHNQPAYLNNSIENVPDCSGIYPVADITSKRGFYLPSSSNLTIEQAGFIARNLEEVIK